jgi:hypothetical protein
VAEDFQLAVVAVGVAMLHMLQRTVAAAERTVGRIVGSIGDRHYNLAVLLLEQLKAVQMLGILVNLHLANHVADLLPFLHAVDAGMPNFLNQPAPLVSFLATMLLRLIFR